MVSFAGLGSHLDVNAMVTALMSVEKQTLYRMERQEKTYQTKISAYGELKNALTNFQKAMEELSSADKFAIYETTISEKDDVDVSTNAQASPGTYSLNISQLATSHKLASTSTFTDSTSSTNASGTMSITVGSESFDVTIDSNSNSLVDIRNAINNASDNAGVKASIMNVDDGMGNTVSRLVLTATETGSTNTISASDTIGDVAATLDMSTDMQQAQDAIFDLDGFTITRASNTVTDAIDGLTLTLKKANNEDITLNVDRNKDAVVDSVDKFVKSYNDLFKTIDKQSYFDMSVSDMDKKHNGDLWDETGLTKIAINLRQEISVPASAAGNIQFLSEIGIDARSSSDGDALKFDKEKLEDALDTNFEDVSKLFSEKTTGFAVRLNDIAEDILGDDGYIELREKTLTDNVRQLEDKKLREEDRLDSLQQKYLEEFQALDTIATKFSSLNNYLLSTLGVNAPV